MTPVTALKYCAYGVTTTLSACGLHNDVVDWDMNELHKEPNEPHDGKAHRCCHGNPLELYSGGKGGYLKHNLFKPHHEVYIPLRSGFVHLCISRFESFMNSFTGFTYATTWSISTRR